MKSNFLFAVIAAVLVVGPGIFLIGRDGTENEASEFISTGDEASSELPINTNDVGTSTSESLFVDGEPISTTTPELGELPETSTTTEKTRDNGIVTYTDSGFSPKTISVEQGDSVTFINNSSRNMWVASNIHPTHNEYPEESDSDCLGSSFDACKGIPVGESWVFTFDRIGDWGYHDHLNASRTGTVVVE